MYRSATRYVSLSMIALFTISIVGCLTPQDYTPLTQFTIDPNIDDTPKSRPSNTTLGIRRFTAAQPLKRDIFYRDPNLRVGNLLDAQWAEFPADMMTRYIFDATTASGRFVDVGLATDISRPTFLLTGDIRRFDLNRTQVPWHADCQIHFELRTVGNGSAAWSETLSASVPLSDDSLAAFPAAMSDAAADVIAQAIAAVVSAKAD